MSETKIWFSWSYTIFLGIYTESQEITWALFLSNKPTQHWQGRMITLILVCQLNMMTVSNVQHYKAVLWMRETTFDIPNTAIYIFLADNLTNTSGSAPQWELKHSTSPYQTSYAREAFGYVCAAIVVMLANYWLTAEPMCCYISRLSAHSAPRSASLLLAHPLSVPRSNPQPKWITVFTVDPQVLCILFCRASASFFGMAKDCRV